MKKVILIFVASITVLLSCNQNDVSETTFKEEKLYDAYSIKIPTALSKEGEGIWNSSSDEKQIIQLQVTVNSLNGLSLDDILNNLANADKREVSQNKSLIKKEAIEVNGLQGLYSVYEKDHNKGVIPVLSHYTFAVLQDGSDVIGISSFSFGKDYTREVLASIKSIKKENAGNTIPKSSEPKIDLNKMKKQGFQIFESDNFIVKCNCKLKTNSDFLEKIKEQGSQYPASAYICSKDERNYDKGTIVNINIYDLSKDYITLSEAKYNVFNEEFINSYATQLKSNNINFKREKFHDVEALRYEFNQMGLPTKALFFVKNKKSYLIQVASRSNLANQFSSIVNSFKEI